MLYLVESVYTQDDKVQINPDDLANIFQDPNIVEACQFVQSTADLEMQMFYKKKLPLIMSSGRHFWMDIDGSNHRDGNKDPIDFHWVASLIPNVLWFVSASGKGMKILIEASRDIDESEISDVEAYLQTTIAKIVGLAIDDGNMHSTFVSYSQIHFSNQIFPIPEVLEKFADQKKIYDYERGSVSDDIYMLVEILRDFPDRTTYKHWLGLVYAALSRYGVDAIPLLGAKWFGERYDVLLKYAAGKDSGYLDALWNSRTVRNEIFDRKRQYERCIIAGAPGAGKSKYAADKILNVFPEPEDVFMQYFIYTVPSVEQAIASAEKFKDRGITYEILVSRATYEKNPQSIQRQLSTKSSNDTMVKIIQLASLMTGSYYKHVKSEHRRLNHIYIDELTMTDFIRPSLAKSMIPRAFLGIHTDDDIHALYDKRFSRADYDYAKFLMEEGSSSHFVSSMLFQAADTTVLTTEELTICCLEQLGFTRKDIRKKDTEALVDTCTLYVYESNNCIKKFVQDKSFKSLIKEHEFENVFANSSEFATGNLMTVKGQHLPGKNLTVLRCLPQAVTAAIAELYSSCFSDTTIDPVALYYKDSLMQAVGRSVGFRGWTEGWVLVHPRVWKLIRDQKFIFKIQDWSVAIDPDFQRSRQQQKDAYKQRDAERARFWKEDTAAKVKNRLIQTGDPKDKLTRSMLKGMFTKGVTLQDVADVFNVPVKKTKKGYHVEGFKFVI